MAAIVEQVPARPWPEPGRRSESLQVDVAADSLPASVVATPAASPYRGPAFVASAAASLPAAASLQHNEATPQRGVALSTSALPSPGPSPPQRGATLSTSALMSPAALLQWRDAFPSASAAATPSALPQRLAVRGAALSGGPHFDIDAGAADEDDAAIADLLVLGDELPVNRGARAASNEDMSTKELAPSVGAFGAEDPDLAAALVRQSFERRQAVADVAAAAAAKAQADTALHLEDDTDEDLRLALELSRQEADAVARQTTGPVPTASGAWVQQPPPTASVQAGRPRLDRSSTDEPDNAWRSNLRPLTDGAPGVQTDTGGGPQDDYTGSGLLQLTDPSAAVAGTFAASAAALAHLTQPGTIAGPAAGVLTTGPSMVQPTVVTVGSGVTDCGSTFANYEDGFR